MLKINYLIAGTGLVGLLCSPLSLEAEEKMSFEVGTQSSSYTELEVDPLLLELKNLKEKFGKRSLSSLKNTCNDGELTSSVMQRTYLHKDTNIRETVRYDLLVECRNTEEEDKHIRWAVNLDNVFTAYSTEHEPLSVSWPNFVDWMFNLCSTTIETQKGDIVYLKDLDRSACHPLAELVGRYASENNMALKSYDYYKRWKQLNEQIDGPAE